MNWICHLAFNNETSTNGLPANDQIFPLFTKPYFKTIHTHLFYFYFCLHKSYWLLICQHLINRRGWVKIKLHNVFKHWNYSTYLDHPGIYPLAYIPTRFLFILIVCKLCVGLPEQQETKLNDDWIETGLIWNSNCDVKYLQVEVATVCRYLIKCKPYISIIAHFSDKQN